MERIKVFRLQESCCGSEEAACGFAVSYSTYTVSAREACPHGLKQSETKHQTLDPRYIVLYLRHSKTSLKIVVKRGAISWKVSRQAFVQVRPFPAT